MVVRKKRFKKGPQGFIMSALGSDRFNTKKLKELFEEYGKVVC